MKSFPAFPDEHSIRLEFVLPVPIEVAWSHLAEAELLSAWLSAEVTGELAESEQIDVQLASESPLSPLLGTTLSGAVDQFTPPQHLTFTLKTLGGEEGVATHVAFELEEKSDAPGKTVLTLTQTRVETEKRPDFALAWLTHLEVLQDRLKGEVPLPLAEIFSNLEEHYRSQPSVAPPRTQR